MSKINLKEIRKELGLTQQKIANELGVNLRTIQKWEAGEVKMRKSTLLNIEGLRTKFVENIGKTPIKDGLFNYTPEDIITHIHKNKQIFEETLMYKLFIEGEIKNEMIIQLEELKKEMKDKLNKKSMA